MAVLPPNRESRMKVWRPAGFEGIEVEKADLVSNVVVPPYSITGHELTVALGGSVTIRYRNENFFFGDYRNLFLMQHPGEVIAASTGTQNLPVSAYTLRISPGEMGGLLDALGIKQVAPYFPSMFPPSEINNALVERTLSTIQAFDMPASALERESRLIDLLRTVLRHCSDISSPQRTLGKEHRAVALVRDALDAQPELDTTLSDLADLVNLHKRYLYNVFKRDVGVSPHAYQSARRVHKAKDLLAAGVPSAQVALETGFHDQSHLTHVFKKYTQVTPGQFQRDTLGDGPLTELNS